MTICYVLENISVQFIYGSWIALITFYDYLYSEQSTYKVYYKALL
jgi:hypothetical protein